MLEAMGDASAAEVVERLWPTSPVRLDPLAGGITNVNFKVEVAGEAFVLRLLDPGGGLLGIDRSVELAAAEQAAARGIAPEVVAHSLADGYLVTRFVPGVALQRGEERTPELIARLAGLLRSVHGCGPLAGDFDVFRTTDRYLELVRSRGGSVPASWLDCLPVVKAIEATLGRRPAVPCHNDLLRANLLSEGERIWLIDWEYAGMGDPMFDLANLSSNHEFEDDENEFLLAAYFGEVGDEQRRDLALMRFMSLLREAAWGVVQLAISELDFDFGSYAAEHFSRLTELHHDPAFGRLLAL